MKKVKFQFLIALMSMLVLVFVSCEKDSPEPEPEPESYIPVLDEDFAFTVTGNDVALTTTLTGNVWFRNEESTTDYTAIDGSVTVNLPVKGDYRFTCNTLVDGATFSSDTFIVAIIENDLSFLDEGIWNALTGGRDGGKVWVLDVEKKFFHNPIDFYGDTEAGGAEDNIWGPWGGTSIYDWGGTPEVGEITFDGATGMATLTLDSEPTTGPFSMEVYDRDPDFLTLTENNGGISLWEHFLTKQYSQLGTLSAEMGDIAFSDGLRFPMDVGRITNDDNANNPSQFLPEDLKNVTLMHCSDSALVMRVKRSFEGDDESKCWLLYNYIVKDYEYEGFTYSESVKTSFTQDDLVGTWKYADVPQGWIAYTATSYNKSIPAHLFGHWDTQADVLADLISWNADDPQATFEAAAAFEFVFNADGSCTLNGIENTYSVSEGVITFGTELTTEFSMVWITLTGTELKVIDVEYYGEDVEAYTPLGLWIGNKNGDKDEYQAVQLVKQ